MDNEDMLNIDDAAKFLEISKPTLYRLIGQDVIKGVKIGQRWRFRKADLTAYLQRSPASVPAAPEEVLDAELAYFAQRLSATGGKLPPLEGAVAVVDETRAPSDIAERKTFQLTGAILALAIAQWASDVHLEPTRADGEICLKVRFRIDGVMHEVRSLPAALRDPVTARFKLMAEMNVAEKRIPQDGRIPIKSGDGDSYDLRVSTVSTISGAESVVMRLLSPSRVILGLDNMGLSAADRAAVDALLARPSGLILCSGPTGSGKTTLLYSFLTQLNKPTCKLMSIEDPVEFLLPGVTQIPVNERIGVTFAAALRSVMRQDPDIILATEIRDAEMAKLLMEAALTGHLVLGTLHTQDAVDGLQRLRDLGIEPFYVSGALAGTAL